MITIKNSINYYQLEKLNSMKEKRHLPKRNTAMHHNVKPVKVVIYPKCDYHNLFPALPYKT